MHDYVRERRMAVKQTNLAGLKSYIGSNSDNFEPTTKKKSYNYNPMFMPVSTQGKPVMKVQTRSGFLGGMISMWRQLKASYFLTFLLGAMALFLLNYNAILAAISAAGSGWFFGTYTKWDFVMNKIMKKRTILEGT